MALPGAAYYLARTRPPVPPDNPMITKPIVFVLGAGAMQPYGFPIGWELVLRVLQFFRGPTDQRAERQLLLQNTDFSEVLLDAFLSALDASGQNSVDAFLEQRAEYLDVGLAAMSIALMRCEQAPSLDANRNPDANWLRYLLREMRSDTLESFKDNRISFVTFNYDRTLEFFLCRALAHSFNKSEEEVGKIIEQMGPIHLHGRLGYLPWQHPSGRPYSPEVDRAAIENCMHHVKVVNRKHHSRRGGIFGCPTSDERGGRNLFFGCRLQQRQHGALRSI